MEQLWYNHDIYKKVVCLNRVPCDDQSSPYLFQLYYDWWVYIAHIVAR